MLGIARRNIPPGADWAASIADALAAARMIVLVFSRESQASGQVRREIAQGVDRDIPILTVRIEDVRPEGALRHFLSTLHWTNAPPPIEPHLPSLAEAVKDILDARGTGRPRPVPVTADPRQPLPFRPTEVPSTDARGSDIAVGAFANSVGMDLVLIRPGRFRMGSPPSEAGRHGGEHEHWVRLTKPFFLGIHPVTQRQWRAVMSDNPSHFAGDDDLPVERVSWEDAVSYCETLSRTEGRTYRLPTEAEWEYACRAGTGGAYAGTGRLDDVGWHTGNSGNETHPVGRKQPNAWGLYDMHGNVHEWCADWHDVYPDGEATDPAGPADGRFRVLRGGSWASSPAGCRAADRRWIPPTNRGHDVGFRVASNA